MRPSNPKRHAIRQGLLGTGVGPLIGLMLLDNIALGIPFGISIGLLIGGIYHSARNRNEA